MATVYRSKKPSGEYHTNWRFAYKDYRGIRRVGTGTPDKNITRKLAETIENEQKEIRLGLRPAPVKNHLARSYASIRDEYLAWGAAQGGWKGRP